MYAYRAPYVIDFTNVNYYIEMHYAIRDGLDFPDYYGGNLDALFDCLTDMLGDISSIEIFGIEKLAVLGGYDERLMAVFRHCKYLYDECADKFLVTIVREDGTRENLD